MSTDLLEERPLTIVSLEFGHYPRWVPQTPVLNLPDFTHTPSTGESSYALLTPLSGMASTSGYARQTVVLKPEQRDPNLSLYLPASTARYLPH